MTAPSDTMNMPDSPARLMCYPESARLDQGRSLDPAGPGTLA